LERLTRIRKWLKKSFDISPKKWGPKDTASEEAQNLITLALDDLLGKLLTHEIHLKDDEEEKKT